MLWRSCLISTCVVLLGALSAADEDVFSVEDGCGGKFTNNTGSFSYNATGQAKCTWQITLAKASQMKIVFSKFQLGTNDTVMVYDGKIDKNNTKRVVNLSGMQDMVVVITFSTSISIVLHQTSNTTNDFTVDYDSTACLVSYEPSFARRVPSPYYLANQSSVTCQYKMMGLPQAVDKVPALAFTLFGVTSGHVLISDGINNKTVNGSSKPELPDDFISNTPSLVSDITMEFTLDKSAQRQIFTAFFSSVDKKCSVITHMTGNMTWTIPSDMSPLTECRLIYLGQKNLLLTVMSSNLKRGSDKVIMTDGGSLGSEPVLDLDTIPKQGDVVTSSHGKLWLRIVVGELPGKRTFTINIAEQDSGSRHYKDGNITMNSAVNTTDSDQYYQFIGSPGDRVSLTLGKNGTLFPKASLDFYDSAQPDGKLLASFKTYKQFFPVMSSGNTMLLIARNIDGAEHFTAQYKFVSNSCDSLSSGSEGQYSLDLTAGQKPTCQWTIHPQVATGFVILSVDSLKLAVNETVTVYSGFMGKGSSIATFDQRNNHQQLPTFSAPVGQGLALVFQSKNTCKNCTAHVLTASYKLNNQACGGILTSRAGILTSPGYPNLYSLNTDCTWYATNISSNVTSKQFFYLSFADLQLGQGHSVKVEHTVNKSLPVKVLAKYGGGILPNDIIIKADKASVEFSSKTINKSVTAKTGRGFKANYWKLDCGGNFTTSNATGAFSTPGYPKTVNKTTLCVWIIRLPVSGKKSNIRNSAQFQIQLSYKDKTSKGAVTIHDGGSVRDPLLRFNFTKKKSNNVIARTNTIVVVYNYTKTAGEDAAEGGMAIKLNFSAFSCDPKHQCKVSKACIHPDWMCNGVDDCGDMTDERNCIGPPSPPANTSGLVKSLWIPVCLILGLLFGAILAFLIPAIYRRIKYPNYSALRDLSAPVST